MHEESDVPMIERNYLFPGVIEMNYQARRRMGVNVFLIDGGTEYALIDIGFLDELSDVLELTRQMDFSLSACKLIVATHADVDHAQGLARAARSSSARSWLIPEASRLSNRATRSSPTPGSTPKGFTFPCPAARWIERSTREIG